MRYLVGRFCAAGLVVAAIAGPVMADSGSSGPPAWLYSVIQPLGICTFGLLLVTFGLGIFRRKLGRRFMKLHLAVAVLTVASAICHGILVLILY